MLTHSKTLNFCQSLKYLCLLLRVKEVKKKNGREESLGMLSHCQEVSYRMLNNSEWICFLYNTNIKTSLFSLSQVFLICLLSAVFIGGWKAYFKIVKVTVQDIWTLNQTSFFLCFSKSSLDWAIWHMICQ